jgi:hypothetical protein
MPRRIFQLCNGAQYTLDVRPDRLDLRDRQYMPPTLSLPAEYPEPAQLKLYFPRYVKRNLVLDQGQDGACTGFGLAAVVNYLLWVRAVNGGNEVGFVGVSPHMLYDLARFYDEWEGQSYEGSSCRGAMKGWHKHGVCEVSFWQKSIYKVPKTLAKPAKASKTYRPKLAWALDASQRPVGVYYRIDRRSVTDIQAAIKDVGAVYVSCEIHPGWKQPSARSSSKSFTHTNIPAIAYNTKLEKIGGHAFALVGYNQQGFIVQNSWGSSWGLNGFGILSYDDWSDNGIDAWVCALGVPQLPRVNGSATGQTVSVTKRANNASLLVGDVATQAKAKNIKAEPWSTERAYLSSVIAGNDGVVEICRPDISSPVDMVASVAYEPVKAWLKNGAGKNSKRVLIFPHGGLNSEPEAIQRARVMGPYFYENGIYPLFYVWKTGIGETLKQELSDRITPSQMETIATGKLSEARDLLIELAAHGPLRWAWRQMKENASRAALQGHAIALLVQSLKKLQDEIPKVEFHLLGHSAGSFVLGHLLTAMQGANVKAKSLTLYAPACPLDFALEKLVSAVRSGVLANDQVWMHILSDERERADYVASDKLYGKSLLYLVDRGFENIRKTPLAGLERTINTKFLKPDDDLWEPAFWNDVQAWRAWVNTLPPQSDGKPACEVMDDRLVSTGPRSIPASHGAFDNDRIVVTRTINRILGQSPSATLAVPVEDLDF